MTTFLRDWQMKAVFRPVATSVQFMTKRIARKHPHMKLTARCTVHDPRRITVSLITTGHHLHHEVADRSPIGLREVTHGSSRGSHSRRVTLVDRFGGGSEVTNVERSGRGSVGASGLRYHNHNSQNNHSPSPICCRNYRPSPSTIQGVITLMI